MFATLFASVASAEPVPVLATAGPAVPQHETLLPAVKHDTFS